MSFERPSRGLLVFQCDACYDTFELSKAEHDIQDFRECWNVMREEGWSLRNMRPPEGGGRSVLAAATEHLCPDCTRTAKSDNANPFRR